MDQNKIQPSNIPASTGSVPVGTVATKTRFNLNQNFILVPGGANLLTNNGQVSNLIAANPNSIVNKGKIMILTTAPASNVGNNPTGTPVALAGQPCVQIRPNTALLSNPVSNSSATSNPLNITGFGNTTTATSIIANIKMNPISNQHTINQIHSIGAVSTVPGSSGTIISSKPQAIQMLTPIVSAANLPDRNQLSSQTLVMSRSTSGVQVQPAAVSKPSSVPVKSPNYIGQNSKTSNKSRPKQGSNTGSTNQQSSSLVTPVILNGANLFVTEKTDQKPAPLEKTPTEKKKKKEPKSLKKVEKPQIIEDIDAEIKQALEQNKKSSRLFSDETLDRASPELWPESVPGVVKFIANTVPPYPVDDEDDNYNEDQDESSIKRQKLSPKPVMSLSDIVKREILDEDDDDDDDDSLQLVSPFSKKMVKTFAITAYGLESTLENEERNDDDQSLSSSPSDSSIEGINNPPSSSNNNNSINNKNNNNGKSKPEWQKDFDEEELSMLYGFGSLTASSLLEKVREIQNLAYQLGLEEEREIARARYLNILNEPIRNDDCPKCIIDQEIDNILYRDLDIASSQTVV